MATNKPKRNIAADTKKVNQVDVCQTPPHALEPLYPYLNKKWVVWESAHGPEQLIVKTLRNKGFLVFGTDLSTGWNYFDDDIDEYDIQITNPPFSIKYEWMRLAFERGKRFALLVPYETTAAARFKTLFRKYNDKPWKIEKLSPERRIVYKMPNKGWNSNPQMPSCWITWGLEIHKTKQAEEVLFEYNVPMRSVRYTDDNQEINK